MSTSDIPAGWQPDPRGRHEYRYWDGSQWTDHVSDQGQVSTDPVADTAAPIAETEQSAVFSPDPTPEPAAAPPAEPEPVAAEPEPEPVVADPEPAPEVTTPADEPEPVVAATPAPEPVAATPASSSAPPAGGATAATPPAAATAPSTAQTDAKAAAQDMLKSKSPELATILTAVVPGSGHFYMGTNKVPLAAGLIAATILALVLSYMSFVLFLVGFVIWVGAVVFGLNDLRGGVRGIEDTVLPKNVIGILLIGAGALLVISLFLPYYRISASADGFGGLSQSGDAFQVFSIEDIILLIIGIGSVVAGAASLGLGPVTSAELPRQLPLAVAIGGAVATVIILFRMFVDSAPSFPSAPGVTVHIGRSFGIWIGLWSAMILLIANAGILRSAANKQS